MSNSDSKGRGIEDSIIYELDNNGKCYRPLVAYLRMKRDTYLLPGVE